MPQHGAVAYQRAAGRYGSDATATASPAKLVVMLYDRLALDLARAQQAQVDGNRETSHENLSHAQEIVAELLASLDVGAWDGGANLASLYRWLIREMVTANVRMDAQRTSDCLSVVEPLRLAWTEALSGGAAASGNATSGSATSGAGLIGATA
jgi:flagellar protein FliS